MRRRLLTRLSLVAVLATSFTPASQASASNDCRDGSHWRVATIGMDRPEWYCEFYAEGPLDVTWLSASGFAIDRLLYQKNDGTIVFERLLADPATDGTTLHVAKPGAKTHGHNVRVFAKKGWRIRVQILVSVYRNPSLPPPHHIKPYRDGLVDITTGT